MCPVWLCENRSASLLLRWLGVLTARALATEPGLVYLPTPWLAAAPVAAARRHREDQIGQVPEDATALASGKEKGKRTNGKEK